MIFFITRWRRRVVSVASVPHRRNRWNRAVTWRAAASSRRSRHRASASGQEMRASSSKRGQTTSSSVKLPAHWGKVALTEVLLYFIRMGPKQLPSVNWHVQYNIGACTCTCMSRCFENWLLLSVNSQIYDVRSGWWNTIASHCVEWPSCVTGACYF